MRVSMIIFILFILDFKLREVENQIFIEKNQLLFLFHFQLSRVLFLFNNKNSEETSLSNS